MSLITSPRATTRGYPGAPLSWPNIEEWARMLAERINSLRDGKVNTFGTVTLTANAATTTVSDRRIGANTVVVLTPTTANAAAAIATTYQTYPNASDGAAVINHANNAQADRTFARILFS